MERRLGFREVTYEKRCAAVLKEGMEERCENAVSVSADQIKNFWERKEKQIEQIVRDIVLERS